MNYETNENVTTSTTHSPATSVSRIPPECLEFILEHVSNDMSTLHRLLLVSRQFFHLTVPILYRSPFRLAAIAVESSFLPCPTVPRGTILSREAASSLAFGRSRNDGTELSRRIKLLVRLLLQNIQTSTLSSLAPRLSDRQISVNGDEHDGEVDLELEPLYSLMAIDDQNNGYETPPRNPPNPVLDQERSIATIVNPLPNVPDKHWTHEQEQDTLAGHPGMTQRNHFPDLISFDDDSASEEDDDTIIHIDDEQDDESLESSQRDRLQQHAESEVDSAAHTGPMTEPSQKGTPGTSTGLLTDYFRHYSVLDHQSISTVLIVLFPGAGQREYDRIMAEIETSILDHNPSKISSIKVQNPSTIIPRMQQNLDLLRNLISVELLDSNWTSQELALVYDFLVAHSTKFPAAPAIARQTDGENQYGTLLRHFEPGLASSSGGAKGIQRLKYRTGRSHWDGVKLKNRPFDPVQFIQAIGSGTGLGLRTIDTMHWPGTSLEQVNCLDTRFLSMLKIFYLVPPHEDQSFSRPEFVSRCRKLRHLEIFTSSSDMLYWAVQDWDARRQRRIEGVVGGDPLYHRPCASTAKYAQSREGQELVPLEYLRIEGFTDAVVYDVLRDACYGFRNSLQVLEAKSVMEHTNTSWMDDSHQMYSGLPHSSTGPRGPRNFRSSSPSSSSSMFGSESAWVGQGESRIDTEQDTWVGGHKETREFLEPDAWAWNNENRAMSEQDKDEGDDEDEDKGRDDEGEDEDEVAERCYNSMQSVDSGLLMIRWTMPQLTKLDLYGPIALQIDMNSLKYMPQLHTVCFTITSVPSLWRRHHRLDGDKPGIVGISDMTCLPRVTGTQLKRVLIRGQWPEITDRSLFEMIETRRPLEDGQGGEAEETWGNQLEELTVLDNTQVTVQGMVRLAQEMDELQVMGLSLHLQPDNMDDNNDYNHRNYVGQRVSRPYRHPATPSSSISSSPSTSSWWASSFVGRTFMPESKETMARNELLKARLELPWVDLGPDANHLGKRTQRGVFLNRDWFQLKE
ncbi:hypothetical protein BGZ94_000209 [Podila epigama]|nr:hypothetical protein BGZ94_000209 [Podila epigama]